MANPPPPMVSQPASHSDAVPRKRLSIFYFWYYGLLGITHPYWSIFLLHRQFSATEIGLLLAVLMGTRIISPNVWGWLADRSGKRMTVIRIGAFLGLLSFCAIFWATSFMQMLAVMAAYSFFWNAVMPQFEAITLEYLVEDPHSYSLIRLWGSVGFICAVVLGGYWFERGIEDFRMAGALFLAMIWLATLCFRAEQSPPLVKTSTAFMAVVTQRPVMAFLCLSFLLQVGHGIYYSFYSLMLEDAGYKHSQIGWFWSLSVLAEIGLFTIMHKLLSRWSVWGILLLSIVLTVLRWLLVAVFAESISLMIVAQCLHAFSFGACHSVSIEYLRRFFTGAHRGRGQALYTSVSFGAGGALGALSGGFLWDSSSAVCFYLAALVSLLALLIAYYGLDARRFSSREWQRMLR